MILTFPDKGIPKNWKCSPLEYQTMQLKERYSALEVARRMRFSTRSNALTQLDLQLTPYLVAPISLIGNQKVLWIFIVAPTQSGKTVFLQVFYSDAIEQDPGTFLYVLPDEASSKKQFDEKVIQTITESPSLNKHIVPPAKMTVSMTRIKLDNMTILPGWARSPGSMNSVTCKKACLDEIRLMPLMIKGETNAVEYLEDRIETFIEMGLGQLAGVTTPAHMNDLMSQQLDRPLTNVYTWYSTCPSCDKCEVLSFWKNFRIEDSAHGEEQYDIFCICSHCRSKYDDNNQKREMNARGIYGLEGLDGEKRVNMPDLELIERMIFRYDSTVSPFRSFQRFRNKYYSCKGEVSRMNNFRQAWCAEFLEIEESKTDVESLMEQQSKLPRGIVPPWTKVLVGGVDSQGPNFVCWIHAYGGGGKSQCIDAFKLSSHYIADDDKIVKDKLNEYLETKIYFDEKDNPWALGLWAIDTGGNRTSQVYAATNNFVKCIRCKGRNIDENFHYNKDLKLYLVNTYNYLETTDEICLSDDWQVFKGIPKEVLKQFCNIKKIRDPKDKKDGSPDTWWKRYGAYDYRYAYIHCEICLDIFIRGRFKFRSKLGLKDWSYNPYVRLVKKGKNLESSPLAERPGRRGQLVLPGKDQGYEVGDFTPGGTIM